MINRVGVIGGGNMGGALIGGLIGKGFSPTQLFLADHHLEKRTVLKNKWDIKLGTSEEIAKNVDILVLAVKPQSMKALVLEISAYLSPQTLIVSIAAGISTSQIEKWLGQPYPIIRGMPNTPALLGEGITGLFANPSCNSDQKRMTQTLLEGVGEVVWVSKEEQMDVVTALSGSGPAYFFYIMESLIESAKMLGLPTEMARKLTYQTALGSCKMAMDSSLDLTELRKQVTSPGGTTEEGIKTLKDGKLSNLLDRALQAATHRGQALSEQYD